MPAERGLFTYSRSGYLFRVFPDRITIRVPGSPTVVEHALADVVDVRRDGEFSLMLQFTDGTQVSYRLGTTVVTALAIIAELL